MQGELQAPSADNTFYPRCPGPPPFPSPLCLPRATSTPHLPKGRQSPAGQENDKASISLQMGTVALFMVYPGAFSHICFCLHCYRKLPFFSLGGASVTYFPIFIVPFLTFSWIEKSKVVNPNRSTLPAEMVLGTDSL